MKKIVTGTAAVLLVISLLSCVSLTDRTMTPVERAQEPQILGRVSTEFTRFQTFNARSDSTRVAANIKERVYTELTMAAREQYGPSIEVRNIVITGSFSGWQIPWAIIGWGMYGAGAILGNFQRINATGDVVAVILFGIEGAERVLAAHAAATQVAAEAAAPEYSTAAHVAAVSAVAAHSAVVAAIAAHAAVDVQALPYEPTLPAEQATRDPPDHFMSVSVGAFGAGFSVGLNYERMFDRVSWGADLFYGLSFGNNRETMGFAAAATFKFFPIPAFFLGADLGFSGWFYWWSERIDDRWHWVYERRSSNSFGLQFAPQIGVRLGGQNRAFFTDIFVAAPMHIGSGGFDINVRPGTRVGGAW